MFCKFVTYSCYFFILFAKYLLQQCVESLPPTKTGSNFFAFPLNEKVISDVKDKELLAVKQIEQAILDFPYK